MVEMGDRLAHGKVQLLLVEFAPEQDIEHVGGGSRLVAGHGQFAQARLVVRRQCGNPAGNAAERQSVGRQNQRLRRQFEIAPDRPQELPDRVAIGLGGPYAGIGADLRQQHVAGDDDAERRAMQRRMLRRVAVADDHVPGIAADVDRIALGDAAKRHRQFIDGTPVGVAAPADGLEVRAVESVGAKQVDQCLRAVAREAVTHGMRGEVFRLGGPHGGAGAAREPAGQPDVVGVIVGDDHACDRGVRGQQGFPGGPRVVRVETAIDDRPAAGVLHQPEIDVVERERQRHAQPAHAGRDLDHRAGGRRCRKRIPQVGLRGWGGGCGDGHGSWAMGLARRKSDDRTIRSRRKPAPGHLYSMVIHRGRASWCDRQMPAPSVN